jgi:hypothetical protein
MSTFIPVAISVLALTVSVFNVWLTWFHRGSVRMTVPSMVAFGYDASGQAHTFSPKVMVRSLLYCTGARGHAIETLFLRLRYQTNEYLFPIWGLCVDKLERGGGLLVTKTGVTAWHHFVGSADLNGFQFGPGAYEIVVLARITEQKDPILLWGSQLVVPPELAPKQHNGADQLWFDRLPESGGFFARLESRDAGEQERWASTHDSLRR